MADQAPQAKGRALGNVLVGFAMLAICLLASSVSAGAVGARQARHVLAPLLQRRLQPPACSALSIGAYGRLICIERCGRRAASAAGRCGAARLPPPPLPFAHCSRLHFCCPRQVRLFSVIKYESVIHEFVSDGDAVV